MAELDNIQLNILLSILNNLRLKQLYTALYCIPFELNDFEKELLLIISIFQSFNYPLIYIAKIIF